MVLLDSGHARPELKGSSKRAVARLSGLGAQGLQASAGLARMRGRPNRTPRSGVPFMVPADPACRHA
jgi:hypothetical protein